jgi:hypothetical protein
MGNHSQRQRYGKTKLCLEPLEDRTLLASGLVAAYGFNEGSGTTLADSSGNGLHGTISGATWTASGKYGGALSFDGVNDWVTVADNNLLDLTGGLTLMAWVRPDVASGVRDVLVKEGTGVDVYNLYARNWRGLPEGNVLVGGSNRTAEGSALAAGTWVHLAATYDGATLRYYTNGSLLASTTISGSIATSGGALRIGGNSLWGEFFDGLIDEVRIYSRALSAAEITTDMNTPVGSPLYLLGAPANHAEAVALTAEVIRPLFEEAVARWQGMWPDAGAVGRLRDVTVEIIDLPGTTLGVASSTIIWIDVNAAGHGWFVDLTPSENSEFDPALADSLAAGRVDLLTVLTHELGHVLGLDDDYGADPYTGDVMAWALPPGVRRIFLRPLDEAPLGDGAQ